MTIPITWTSLRQNVEIEYNSIFYEVNFNLEFLISPRKHKLRFNKWNFLNICLWMVIDKCSMISAIKNFYLRILFVVVLPSSCCFRDSRLKWTIELFIFIDITSDFCCFPSNISPMNALACVIVLVTWCLLDLFILRWCPNDHWRRSLFFFRFGPI